jgi:predicted phosphodiesterase
MADDVVSALVLLGDLHLGSSFHGETELPPLDWSTWTKLFGGKPRLDAFFSERCIAHNKAIMRALPRYLRRQLKQLRERQGFPAYEFDQYVLLGDLVTWPSPASFAFLREYITRDEWLADPADKRKTPGLHIKPDRLIAIPGNHDKLLRPDLGMFHDKFVTPLGLDCPEPQTALLIRTQTGKVPFVFLTIDASTYTTEKPLKVTRAARSHLAGGVVTDALLASVRSAADLLIEEHADAVKIMVIHYPVDYAAAREGSALGNLVVPHHVQDIDRLLDALPQGTIDFAVHGHLHNPGVYNHRGIPVVSVGTAFQRKATVNDVFLVKVFESGQIRAEHHVWHKTGFELDDNPKYHRALN